MNTFAAQSAIGAAKSSPFPRAHTARCEPEPIPKRHSRLRLRDWSVRLAQAGLIAASFAMAVLLRFDFEIPLAIWPSLWLWAGALIIFGAGYYTTLAERRKARAG